MGAGSSISGGAGTAGRCRYNDGLARWLASARMAGAQKHKASQTMPTTSRCKGGCVVCAVSRLPGQPEQAHSKQNRALPAPKHLKCCRAPLQRCARPSSIVSALPNASSHRRLGFISSRCAGVAASGCASCNQCRVAPASAAARPADLTPPPSWFCECCPEGSFGPKSASLLARLADFVALCLQGAPGGWSVQWHRIRHMSGHPRSSVAHPLVG